MNLDGLDTVVPAHLHRKSAGAALEQLQMIHTYLEHGGLVTGDEAATRLGRYREQPISVVARWIVAGKVVNFPWKSEMLVPLFQFDPADMSLRPAVSKVIAELNGAFDDLELAQWFTRPNGWLGDAEPVAVIAANPAAVVQAARADRFITKG